MRENYIMTTQVQIRDHNPGLKVKLAFDFSCIKAYIRANFLCGFILV